jgi:hypothetical protein
MAASDPTKDPEFQRVLGNLLKMPHKPHSEMKLGKKRGPACTLFVRELLGRRKIAPPFSSQLHPVVEPQVSHFMQVPLRTRVKLPHSVQASPS